MALSLEAGYGQAVVTPELGVGLVGYGPYLDRTATEVADELMVRAVFVRSADAAAVIISCDLIGFDIATSDGIRARVAEACGIDAAGVMLSCTHTHSGPASQQYRAMATVDRDYLVRVQDAIAISAASANECAEAADVTWGSQIVEPIGFNRRHGSFQPIDPAVRVCRLRTGARSIYIVNYACHPVALGISGVVSADWPGATVRRLESAGHHAVVLQGFCGDIDPVTNRNSWGAGTADDLDLVAGLLANRALKAVASVEPCREATVRAKELRVDLPLDVPSISELAEHAKQWRSRLPDPGNGRLIDEWSAEAQRALMAAPPPRSCVSVPVQSVSIGSGALVGLPGEVFCDYGLGLDSDGRIVAPVGFCGGNIGYLPTADGFADAGDYAAYLAPKYYGLFPFRPETEGILRDAMDRASRVT